MTLRQMAGEYRKSADLIHLRIIALKDEASRASGPEHGSLMQRIHELQAMYRQTRELAVVLERYYQGRRKQE